MVALGEVATKDQGAGGSACDVVDGPAEGAAASAALLVTSGPAAHAHAALAPTGARLAQRPAGFLRKRGRECGAPPVVARAVRPMVAKPVAIAPCVALQALAAQVQMQSTATALEDIFIQSAAVLLAGSACGRPDRGVRAASAAC